jgi:hypothetical protein
LIEIRLAPGRAAQIATATSQNSKKVGERQSFTKSSAPDSLGLEES